MPYGPGQVRQFGRRNRFLNGDMRVCGRNVMPTADNSYAIDGCRIELGAANAATVVQETSDTPAGGSPRAVKMLVGSANANKFGIFIPVSFADMWDLRGGVASVQVKLKATANLTDIRMALLQRTAGTADGSATVPNSLIDPITTWGATGAGITTYADNWAQANTPASLGVTTSWAAYRLQGVPISASAVNLALFVWLDETATNTQTTDYFLATDAQLESGGACTEFERIPESEQRANCEYMLQTFGGAQYASIAMGMAVNSTLADFSPIMRRPMRVLPGLVVTQTDWLVQPASGPIACTALATQYGTPNSLYMRATVASGLTLGQSVHLMPNVAGSLLHLSAEL